MKFKIHFCPHSSPPDPWARAEGEWQPPCASGTARVMISARFLSESFSTSNNKIYWKHAYIRLCKHSQGDGREQGKFETQSMHSAVKLPIGLKAKIRAAAMKRSTSCQPDLYHQPISQNSRHSLKVVEGHEMPS